jgi:hypothetical protein
MYCDAAGRPIQQAQAPGIPGGMYQQPQAHYGQVPQQGVPGQQQNAPPTDTSHSGGRRKHSPISQDVKDIIAGHTGGETAQQGQQGQHPGQSSSGHVEDPRMTKLVEGAIATAGAVAAAHHEIGKRGSSTENDKDDPRIEKLIEGVVATAGGVALAHHEMGKK